MPLELAAIASVASVASSVKGLFGGRDEPDAPRAPEPGWNTFPDYLKDWQAYYIAKAPLTSQYRPVKVMKDQFSAAPPDKRYSVQAYLPDWSVQGRWWEMCKLALEEVITLSQDWRTFDKIGQVTGLSFTAIAKMINPTILEPVFRHVRELAFVRDYVATALAAQGVPVLDKTTDASGLYGVVVYRMHADIVWDYIAAVNEDVSAFLNTHTEAELVDYLNGKLADTARATNTQLPLVQSTSSVNFLPILLIAGVAIAFFMLMK